MIATIFAYTGDGVDNRQVATGQNTTPLLVVLFGNTAQISIWKTASMGTDTAPYSGGAAVISGAIKSLNSDGTITLGTDATANGNTVAYYGLAIVDDGAGDVAVGSYTGNGSDNRDISIAGTLSGTPDLVWIKRSDSQGFTWRSSLHSGDSASFNAAGADAANIIQAFGSGTFQVGTNNASNASGQTYYYAAFKAAANVFAVFTYTGNGADNRDVTGLTTFRPAYVFTHASNQVSFIRTDDIAGDASKSVSANAFLTDRIQAILDTGMQVGTNAQVNNSGTTYIGYAFGVRRIPIIQHHRQQQGAA